MKKYTKVFNKKPSLNEVDDVIKEAENFYKGRYVKHFIDSKDNIYLIDVRIID